MRYSFFACFLFAIGTSVATSAAEPSDAEASSASESMQIFEQRILPIFRSPNPSSCVQCHLSSVDLKDYILPSSRQTFLSLRAQGLIDLDHPDQSKILKLIRMGEEDKDSGAILIHKETRDAELRAFTTWIQSCCADESLRKLTPNDKIAKPELPDGVIRHARKSRIVDSFVRNVWSQRMRCFPCHTPHEINPDNPKHKIVLKRQRDLESKYDAEMVQRLKIFKKTPEETVRYLLSDSAQEKPNRLPLINIETPQNSLLILKPTSKLPPRNADKTFSPPSYELTVSHMGGLKMHEHDQGYKSVLSWIEDYRNIAAGKYRSVDDLPSDNWHSTQKIVRLKNVPERFAVGTVVQLFVHQSNGDEAIGFTQGTVTPRKIVNGALTLFGNDGAVPQLKPGDFVLKVYADTNGRIDKNPTGILDEKDFIGKADFTAHWKDGFKNAEMIDGNNLEME